MQPRVRTPRESCSARHTHTNSHSAYNYGVFIIIIHVCAVLAYDFGMHKKWFVCLSFDAAIVETLQIAQERRTQLGAFLYARAWRI